MVKKLDLETDPERLGEAGARMLLEALRQEIGRHDHLYHVEDRPEVSDDVYDRLFQRLRSVERAYPELVTSDSPSQRVGGEPQDRFETLQHAAEMLSLDSSQDPDEVTRFDERMRKAVEGALNYVLEPKLDGASIELVYQGGVLSRAVTRGNGREGEGVTDNARTIASIPLRLREAVRPAPPFLSVRGEVMMYISAFERLNEGLLARGAEPYASPRNSAAGALRQLDSRITAERELVCVAYDVLEVEGTRFDRDADVVEALRAWGFRVPEGVETTDSLDAIHAYHARWAEARDALDYEIDGVVVKLNDLGARADLGATSHHPRWALAYKFEPRKEVTRVERIAVSVGRTGVLTPVALLRPVVVGGVTISRASLHNREEVHRKDVREGDAVRIQRAGDVIPQVVERIEEPEHEARPRFEMPEVCPACGSELEERGPFTACPNRFACPAQLKGRLVHFGSRGALDIEGLGEETASLLVDRGLVTELADLYELDVESLIGLPGFAERSAQNLVAALDARRRPELARFLHGLGIPEVGATVARDLARHFGSLENLLEANQEALEAVPGVGPKMSEAIRAFFTHERNRAALAHIEALGVHPERVLPLESGQLAGRSFAFTGALETLSRSQAKALVEGQGARVTGSVSRATDYVVVGSNPGSKAEAAKALGVETLSEAAFKGMLQTIGVELAE